MQQLFLFSIRSFVQSNGTKCNLYRKKIAITFFVFFCFTFVTNAQDTAVISIQNNSKWTISRHIYGHFSEHLGHCLYGGFWVDSSLPVPKKDRIRMDVVEALKKIKVPNLRWPGG